MATRNYIETSDTLERAWDTIPIVAGVSLTFAGADLACMELLRHEPVFGAVAASAGATGVLLSAYGVAAFFRRGTDRLEAALQTSAGITMAAVMGAGAYAGAMGDAIGNGFLAVLSACGAVFAGMGIRNLLGRREGRGSYETA